MRLLLLPALLVACSSGYRTQDESADLRRDLDDRTIESEVRAALGSNELTWDQKIEVESDEGVVTLTGTVTRDAAARRAADLASRIEGVRRVIVKTKLASGSSASE